MFCPYCGSQIENDRPFCSNCGGNLKAVRQTVQTDQTNSQTPQQEFFSQPVYRNAEPVTPKISTTPALVYGIISSVLCTISIFYYFCFPFFGLPGLILAIIGKYKIKDITELGIPVAGKLKAANSLCVAAIVLGIISAVIFTIVIFIGIIQLIIYSLGKSF